MATDTTIDVAISAAPMVRLCARRAEAFPVAVPPEAAERQKRQKRQKRRCRRARMEAWSGREGVALRLPPSRLALDPALPRSLRLKRPHRHCHPPVNVTL